MMAMLKNSNNGKLTIITVTAAVAAAGVNVAGGSLTLVRSNPPPSLTGLYSYLADVLF